MCLFSFLFCFFNLSKFFTTKIVQKVVPTKRKPVMKQTDLETAVSIAVLLSSQVILTTLLEFWNCWLRFCLTMNTCKRNRTDQMLNKRQRKLHLPTRDLKTLLPCLTVHHVKKNHCYLHGSLIWLFSVYSETHVTKINPLKGLYNIPLSSITPTEKMVKAELNWSLLLFLHQIIISDYYTKEWK